MKVNVHLMTLVLGLFCCIISRHELNFKVSFSLTHFEMLQTVGDLWIVLDVAGNTIDDDKFSVSTRIEKANKNVGTFAPQGFFRE